VREARTAIARLGGALALLLAACGLAHATSSVRLELEGPMTQGGLVYGRAAPDARVRFDGDPVRLSPRGVFLIGFGRDAPRHEKLVVELPDGERVTRTLDIKRRQYRIQRINGLKPSQVTPPKSAWPKIRHDIAIVKKARTRDDPRTDFLDDFRWPVTGPITGVYGSQRVYNGKPRSPHYGIDIAVPAGSIVHAPAGGIVTLAQPDMYFSGGTVIVDHGHGLSSCLLHMRKLFVKVGDHVAEGDPIGEVGTRGRSTGPHVHWGVNLFSRRIDPRFLVGPMPSANQASAQ